LIGSALVDTKDLRDLVSFDAEGPGRADVLESERLWSEVLCLDRNQHYGPVKDLDSDALFLVVAGEVTMQVDRRRRRLKQWSMALVPASSEATVTNASTDPAVVLVVAAPPPTPRAVTG
jgi:mannose-6-phosphate isomerase-like protein (cupin superfamily)